MANGSWLAMREDRKKNLCIFVESKNETKCDSTVDAQWRVWTKRRAEYGMVMVVMMVAVANVTTKSMLLYVLPRTCYVFERLGKGKMERGMYLLSLKNIQRRWKWHNWFTNQAFSIRRRNKIREKMMRKKNLPYLGFHGKTQKENNIDGSWFSACSSAIPAFMIFSVNFFFFVFHFQGEK